MDNYGISARNHPQVEVYETVYAPIWHDVKEPPNDSLMGRFVVGFTSYSYKYMILPSNLGVKHDRACISLEPIQVYSGCDLTRG